MLRKTKDLTGYAVCATDGDIGAVRDFYYDDVTWTVRYFCVGTTGSFGEREILASPVALSDIDDNTRSLRLDLKQGKVAGSPAYARERPITREYEMAYSAYYGWPAYWGGTSRWGDELYPTELFNVAPFPPPGRGGLLPADSIMHDAGRLAGYKVFTADDIFAGEVVDLLVSDMSWAVHFLIVDSGELMPGSQVLVSPHWISAMSDGERFLTLDIPRDAVVSAPPYRPDRPVTRDYELTLFDHYGRADEIDTVFVGRQAVHA